MTKEQSEFDRPFAAMIQQTVDRAAEANRDHPHVPGLEYANGIPALQNLLWVVDGYKIYAVETKWNKPCRSEWIFTAEDDYTAVALANRHNESVLKAAKRIS